MNNKSFAITAVTIMLLASCSAAIALEPQDEDGFPPLVVPLLIAGSSFAAGWFVNDIMTSDDDQSREYLRLASANNIHDVSSVALVFTTNANSNYAQVWGMTKEHWIRQAEVEAYSQWGKIAYDSNTMMQGSDILNNNAIMTANAVAQIGSFFNELSDKISEWPNDETYSGKMSAGFVMGNKNVMSSSSINAKLVSVTSGNGKVFIGNVDEDYIVTTDDYTPGYIYNPGNTATITSDSGLTYSIPKGLTYIDDLFSTTGHKALDEGVYTINGTLASDCFASVISDRVPLKAGLLIERDGTGALAVLENGMISYGSASHNGLAFKVEASEIPEGKFNPDTVDVMPLLEAYQKLLDKLYWTTVSANNAARAVWDIYDQANEKNYNVTTLMNSNVYDTVVLSSAMNEVMTLSAMQQLTAYYDTHAEDLTDLQIGLYSEGMDAPFVRGSIIDKYGNTAYEDVIFTPFFQTDDVTLERGTQFTVNQNTFAAIWHDGTELNAWYTAGMDTKGYETLYLEEGYVLHITQLATCDDDGMHNQSKIDFKVTKVHYIEPGKTNLTKDIVFGDLTMKNVLQIICLIVGFILLAVGVFKRDPLSIVLGIVLVVFAVVFADPVWEWITSLKFPWW